MSAPVPSDTRPRLQNPTKGQKKKVLVTAKAERRPEMSTVSPKVLCKQNDSGNKVPDDSVCLAKKGQQCLGSSDASAGDVPEQRSKRKRPLRKRKPENVITDPGACTILASSNASAGDVPEQPAKRKRGQKTKTLADVKAATQESSLRASGPATSEATPEAAPELKISRRRTKRSIWTVDRIEGTKLIINKKRRLSYRTEDLEAFYRLLEDPVIQNFLAADIFFRVTDKYLLSMVVEYFGRLGLPGHLYNRIHFFLALYIACDMEEDDPISKRSIFQFLLGRDTWQDLYKDFQRLQKEFLQVIDYHAWVTRQECEEIQNQNPHHWVWSRVRHSAP
ncbi:speedy protein E4-like [Peromyscus leucopus]|uniref:speedy protein E4-like n=1 Tax=Peromyscus leucopus TaxID=10041 RepID=UPI0010A0EDB6|nr:speedy protein E4-like [Peromyscus leucopus]